MVQLRFPAVVAADLCEMRGWRERGEFNVDARSHPDFSTNGAPLRLGFTIYRNAFYHTSDGQGLTAATCFDNFHLAVERTPPGHVPPQ